MKGVVFPDLKHYVSKFELSFVKIKFYEGAGKFHLSSKVIKTLLIHKEGYKTLLEKTKQYWVDIKFTRIVIEYRMSRVNNGQLTKAPRHAKRHKL